MEVSSNTLSLMSTKLISFLDETFFLVFLRFTREYHIDKAIIARVKHSGVIKTFQFRTCFQALYVKPFV
jgi:hypothetical protein